MEQIDCFFTLDAQHISIDEVPARFLPEIRETRGEIHLFYENLSEGLIAQEKVFLAQQFQKQLERKPIIINPTKFYKNGDSSITYVGICERYNINVNTLKYWLKRYHDNEVLYDFDLSGQPSKIDEIGLRYIVDEITKLKSQYKSPSPQKRVEIYQQAYQATLVRRNKALNGNYVVKQKRTYNEAMEEYEFNEVCTPLTDMWLHTKTISTYDKLTGVSVRTAQSISQARLKALMDIRLSYKVACTYWGYCRYLPSCCKWNADCTTVVVKPSGSNKLVCTILDSPDEKVESVGVTEDLAILIKLYVLGNAMGELGKMVAIVAVDGIPEGEFFECHIPGFTNTTICDAVGSVYLCASKAGCPALWQHLFLTYIIPEIEKSDGVHQPKVRIYIYIYMH